MTCHGGNHHRERNLIRYYPTKILEERAKKPDNRTRRLEQPTATEPVYYHLSNFLEK